MAKVEKKVKAQKVEKKPIIKAAKVEFVRLIVRAVIPVQQYGNIQPEIEVIASSYEAARDFAMPKIEELWRTYAERPVNGNLPSFVGPVKVEEKMVVAHGSGGVGGKAGDPKDAVGGPGEPKKAAGSTQSAASPEVDVQLSEAGTKAKKMIDVAATADALNLVEQKIKDSVKVPAEEKPVLYAMVLKKRKSI